ncbi:MAG: hypothetical protein WAT71_01930 [Ignavibacteria bacterium]
MDFTNVIFDLDRKCGTAEGEITFSIIDCYQYPAHISGFFKLNVLYNDYYWEISEMKFPEID